MTQMQIEQLTQQEYTHYLAYGEPVLQNTLPSYDNHQYEYDSQENTVWISTLDSMTYPGMTFGYNETVRSVTPLCISTAV